MQTRSQARKASSKKVPTTGAKSDVCGYCKKKSITGEYVGSRRAKETAFCGKGHHPEVMDSSGNPTGMCAQGHHIPIYCGYPVYVVDKPGATVYTSMMAPRKALATKAVRRLAPRPGKENK